ncbi:MAG TPA: peptide chain release factor N(5)-glutamine methyltransferase [Solirubrobacteraceae bacterium]|nr:peptide chain release factor N(5)-glutamine methyltransferase [Solirubrobacteraceae bacterium]
MRGTTVRDALDSARIPLRAAGVTSPDLDAEVLLAAVLGVDRAALHADPERELPAEAVRPFQDAVLRRRKREPVAYILGRKPFRFIELEVDRRVLIPRPETETLVEAALAVPEGARVLDVGTGSGAVALALKHERPDLRVSATDVSRRALEVAEGNARRLGLDVEFSYAELFDRLPGSWDAVVSNPPYVRDGDRGRLAPEILRHEPEGAVFAGPDGLEVLRRLIPEAAARAPWVAVEVGAGQAAAVRALFAVAGLPELSTHTDLAGIERVVVGRR